MPYRRLHLGYWYLTSFTDPLFQCIFRHYLKIHRRLQRGAQYFLFQEGTQIERKAMIRNRYNYLIPSVSRHQRRRWTHHNQNTTSRKPTGYPKLKRNHQGIHAKTTYNYRISKQQQKHRLGTVSKILLGEGGGGEGA